MIVYVVNGGYDGLMTIEDCEVFSTLEKAKAYHDPNNCMSWHGDNPMYLNVGYYVYAESAYNTLYIFLKELDE